MDWTKGKSGSVVEWTLSDDAPEQDISWLEVKAKEKISRGCADNVFLVSLEIIDIYVCILRFWV